MLAARHYGALSNQFTGNAITVVRPWRVAYSFSQYRIVGESTYPILKWEYESIKFKSSVAPLWVASFPSGSYKWRWRMKKSNRFIEMPLTRTFKETVKSISFKVAVGVVNAARGLPLILPKPLTTARHLINHFTVQTQEHLRGMTCMIYGQKEGVTFKRESGQSVVSL